MTLQNRLALDMLLLKERGETRGVKRISVDIIKGVKDDV